MKKRLAAGLLAIMMLLTTSAYGLTDGKILSDPVQRVYEGRTEASAIINNVNFADVPSNHWAQEAIARMGAMGLIRGDTGSRNYRPNSSVSNEEAMAFIIRLLGMEEQARVLGNNLVDDMPVGTSSSTLWSLGYLNQAYNMGMITEDDFDDCLVTDQSLLGADSFFRSGPATREDVAKWVVTGLNRLNAENFPLPTNYVRIYNMNDWSQIDIEAIPYVEAALNHGIMSGVSGNTFSPKGAVSRAQMAQILKNMDEVYYTQMGYLKKTGTIGTYQDEQDTTTGSGLLYRNYYIRSADGTVDIIRYELAQNSSPAPNIKDAVVYNAGSIVGLPSLREGDEIEYIVTDTQPDLEEGEEPDPDAAYTVLYVQKVSGYTESTVTGRLYVVDVESNQITLKDSQDKLFTYTLAQGLLNTNTSTNVSTLIVDNEEQNIAYLNVGSTFELTLANGVVKSVKFIGQPIVVQEIRGIVVENNPDLGYITVYDNNGNRVSKNYYEGQLTVKKLQYYDIEDEIGYISQVFPNFRYNPMDGQMSDIELGDIVFMQLDPDDTSTITAISATTNYAARYGKILQIDTSTEVNSLLIQYENGQTDWIDIVPGVFVSKNGKAASTADILAGDWIRVLVNMAIIEPGYVMESAKEVTIEGDERHISSIVKGEIGSIDGVQKKLSIQNYQELTKTGWSNYQEIARLDLSGNDIEIYYNGQRVSLDYVSNYFKRGGGEAYIALENYYGGQRVKMLTIRTERDQLLNSDTIIAAFGDGSFMLSSGAQTINSDAGTIVRRHGRLVNANSIMVPDYATIALNGDSRAAVVDITEASDNSGVVITVSRGRIQSINEGNSFTVQSMALLTGMKWVLTPIQRIFTIDYNTKFYDSGGYVDRDTFIDYSSDSVVDKSFTVITDGTRADWVIEQPYAQKAARGTVYSVDGDDTLLINYVSFYDNVTARWSDQGNRNTASVEVPQNSVVIKNNQISDISKIVPGDQIRVMTDTLPTTASDGMSVTGYIIYVEN